MKHTLSEIVGSGSEFTPAMNLISDEFAKYQSVMVMIGGSVVILFVLLSLIFWTKFKQAPKLNKFKWGFEKKVNFSFVILSIVVASLVIMISVTNLTNTLNPLEGFSWFVC